MGRLDHPVVGSRKQAHLLDTERRDDEAPDEHYERQRPGSAGGEAERGENPQADDKQAAEHHMELHQRKRVSGPEENAEQHESDAEEAEEYARDENDVLHG